MFTTLVVALDLAPDNDRALPIARALASTGNATVELVTICEPGLPNDVDRWELERRARQFASTSDAWCIVHDVDAARALVHHAASRPDSLLLMATSARSPIRSSFFGGVTRDVLRTTDQPVLLIGPNVPTSFPPGSTLVPCIDAGEAADRSVPTIVSWQATFRGTVPQLAEVVAAGDDAAADRRLAAMASLLADHGVPVSTHLVHHDDTVAGLEALADRFTGSVYVATSGRATDGRWHWHSVTQELVHRAAHPVLVVPARPVPLTARQPAAPLAAPHRPFHDVTVPGSLRTA